MPDLHRFYVTAKRGDRFARIAGPFPSYLMAADHVEPARRAAYDVDPWAPHYSYGVSKYASTRPAPLNGRLGLPTKEA